MVQIKNYVFNHFYWQYLVLLTMAPRNSLSSKRDCSFCPRGSTWQKTTTATTFVRRTKIRNHSGRRCKHPHVLIFDTTTVLTFLSINRNGFLSMFRSFNLARDTYAMQQNTINSTNTTTTSANNSCSADRVLCSSLPRAGSSSSSNSQLLLLLLLAAVIFLFYVLLLLLLLLWQSAINSSLRLRQSVNNNSSDDDDDYDDDDDGEDVLTLLM